MTRIELVRSDVQASAVEALAWEFVAWLKHRYPDMLDFIEAYMKAQKFAKRMSDVRVDYNPPHGEALLALVDDAPVGILMMHGLEDGDCEMNRMFVRDSARGLGIGRKLAHRLIDVARESGFKRMKLGALPRHFEALGLYNSLGFVNDDSAPLAGSGEGTVSMVLVL